jgi:DNA-binding response OmpR family regulator
LLANNQVKVLCIEGKKNHNHIFADELAKRGYLVKSVKNGTRGLDLLPEFTPSIVIINTASLRTDGSRITKRFRNCLPTCPIVLIVPDHADLVENHEANIVLQLPFTVQKLINRMRLFQHISEENICTVGPLQLNIASKIVTYNGKEASLTPRLTQLLIELMKKPGEVVLRETLFQHVWETNYLGDTRTLDVHISWLRRALEEDPHHPQLILTVRSIGYKLDI